MSEAERTSTTSSAESSGNRPQLYKLIFDQNLDEVHLLIDFVSGRIGRSLTTLTIPGRDRGSDPMTSREIIQAVADMRFPPKGPDAINAENAGLLLLAKDALSALAAPATGLTIAYTAMFVDAEVKTGPRRAFTWLSGLLSRQPLTRGDRTEKDIRRLTRTMAPISG